MIINPASAALDAVTVPLTAHGWIRADTTTCGRTNARFSHPATAATITITDDRAYGTSAYVFCDDATSPNGTYQPHWKVDCSNPEAEKIAAAATAVLGLKDQHGRDLAEVLTEAGWPAEHKYAAGSGRLLEVRFTGPDGTEASLLPGDDHEPDGWLITRFHPARRTATYLPSSDTPPAVLAAFAMPSAPTEPHAAKPAATT